jgi:hypothetical protein
MLASPVPFRPPASVFVALSLGFHGALAVALGHADVRGVEPGFQPKAETLAGDTLNVEPAAPEESDPDPSPSPLTAAPSPTSATRPPTLPNALAGVAAEATRKATAPHEETFGATGVRFATDLATTFTRAFPQAASADEIWGQVPFGSAGTAEVALVLDETGRLSGASILGAPSAALRRAVDRTLVILAPRVFTSSGPSVHLRVTARVTRDDVHDGLHGDVFALSGGSFSGDVGTAFFALPQGSGLGRRIDVEIRLLH